MPRSVSTVNTPRFSWFGSIQSQSEDGSVSEFGSLAGDNLAATGGAGPGIRFSSGSRSKAVREAHTIVFNARGLRFSGKTAERVYRAWYLEETGPAWKTMSIAVTLFILIFLVKDDLRSDEKPMMLVAVRGSSLFASLFGIFVFKNAHKDTFLTRHMRMYAVYMIWHAVFAILAQDHLVLRLDHAESEEGDSFTVLITLVIGGLGVLPFDVFCVSTIGILLCEIAMAAYNEPLSAAAYTMRVIVLLLGCRLAYTFEVAQRRQYTATKLIDAENVAVAKTEAMSQQILLNILPKDVAARVQAGDTNVYNHHDNIVVFFADIVGFTSWAARTEPHQLVKSLNLLFCTMDDLARRRGVSKDATVGDAYQASSNDPRQILSFALAVSRSLADLRSSGVLPTLNMRTGIAIGKATSGVVGEQRFSFVTFGPAVEEAVFLEGTGTPGQLHVNTAFRAAMSESGDPVLMRLAARATETTHGGHSVAFDLLDPEEETALVLPNASLQVYPQAPTSVVDTAASSVPQSSVTSIPVLSSTCERGDVGVVSDVSHQDTGNARAKPDSGSTSDTDDSAPPFEEQFLNSRCRFRDRSREKLFWEDHMIRHRPYIMTSLIASNITWIALGLSSVVAGAPVAFVAFEFAIAPVLQAITVAWGWTVQAADSETDSDVASRLTQRARYCLVARVVVLIGVHLLSITQVEMEGDETLIDLLVQHSVLVFFLVLEAEVAFVTTLTLALGLLLPLSVLYVGELGSARYTSIFSYFALAASIGLVGRHAGHKREHQSMELRRIRVDAVARLRNKQQQTDNLLLNVLPYHILQSLRGSNDDEDGGGGGGGGGDGGDGGGDGSPPAVLAAPDGSKSSTVRLGGTQTVIAESAPRATLMFIHLKGFLQLQSHLSAAESIQILSTFVELVDAICEEHRVDKIKVVFGSVYFAGTALEASDDPLLGAARMATVALEVRSIIDKLTGGRPDITVHIGLATGPVTAGVIGKMRFGYDCWSDAVNTASRMSTYAKSSQVLVTDATRAILDEALAAPDGVLPPDLLEFSATDLGVYSIKGRGLLRVHELVPAARARTAVAPDVPGDRMRLVSVCEGSLESSGEYASIVAQNQQSL